MRVENKKLVFVMGILSVTIGLLFLLVMPAEKVEIASRDSIFTVVQKHCKEESEKLGDKNIGCWEPEAVIPLNPQKAVYAENIIVSVLAANYRGGDSSLVLLINNEERANFKIT